MVSREWLDGEPVVILEKNVTKASITWNAHFSDPTFGDLANDCILNNLGDKLLIRVRYSWNDVYGNDYHTYKVWMERKTVEGTWELLPNGYHEPLASDFNNPAGHSIGHSDKLYEIVADDSYVKWRMRVDVKTGGSLPTGSTESGSSGGWDVTTGSKICK